jgi:hypothetical protein
MRAPFISLSPLAAAVSLALSAALPAQADTIIDHANGYTLNAGGALQRFTSLASAAKRKRRPACRRRSISMCKAKPCCQA